jgi:membrane associated rhomboid family serine protease
MQKKNDPLLKNDDWVSQRIMGAFILIISIGAGFFTVVKPLQAMLSNETYVSYFTEGVMISVAGTIFGLMHLAFGRESMDRLMLQESKVGKFVVALLTFGLAIFVYFAWEALARSLGYE